jgi:hypothetical protein
MAIIFYDEIYGLGQMLQEDLASKTKSSNTVIEIPGFTEVVE